MDAYWRIYSNYLMLRDGSVANTLALDINTRFMLENNSFIREQCKE
jgi:hypothetical protein